MVRPSNTPTGRLVRASLPLRDRCVRLVRSSNTPTGKLVRSLLPKPRDVRLVRLSNALALMCVKLPPYTLRLVPQHALQLVNIPSSMTQHEGK